MEIQTFILNALGCSVSHEISKRPARRYKSKVQSHSQCDRLAQDLKMIRISSKQCWSQQVHRAFEVKCSPRESQSLMSLELQQGCI